MSQFSRRLVGGAFLSDPGQAPQCQLWGASCRRRDCAPRLAMAAEQFASFGIGSVLRPKSSGDFSVPVSRCSVRGGLALVCVSVGMFTRIAFAQPDLSGREFCACIRFPVLLTASSAGALVQQFGFANVYSRPSALVRGRAG